MSSMAKTKDSPHVILMLYYGQIINLNISAL